MSDLEGKEQAGNGAGGGPSSEHVQDRSVLRTDQIKGHSSPGTALAYI